jgi:hypothetical protein
VEKGMAFGGGLLTRKTPRNIGDSVELRPQRHSSELKMSAKRSGHRPKVPRPRRVPGAAHKSLWAALRRWLMEERATLCDRRQIETLRWTPTPSTKIGTNFQEVGDLSRLDGTISLPLPAY